MSTASYTILGGNFEHGGSASARLKEFFKRVGAEPQAIRRAVIAAYEAEMNVVIHAHRGQMLVRFHDNRVDVEVADEGPGIPDIELAMTEGYSTAPAAARELGFGAGMGLPNILKNSEAFSIESTVGRGTCLRFSVAMRPGEGVRWGRNSIRIADEQCTKCMRCVSACPTWALRVRHGGPELLGHLCIDCADCIAACPSGAIGADLPDSLPPLKGTALVPPALLVQFGAGVPVAKVLDAFRALGFEDVIPSAPAERALRAAVIAWERSDASARPVISPVCPAVVNLVQARFPSLIPHLAPFLSPLEAMLAEWQGGEGVLVPACPSQCTLATQSSAAAPLALASPKAMRQALAPLVLDGGGADRQGSSARPGREPAEGDVLRVYGIRHAMALLDRIEDGLCRDLTVVEPYACELGCFGSPLLWEEPFVAWHRWRRVAGRFEGDAAAVGRKEALRARDGVRLDADMSRAIEKLARIESLARALPGRDCGICGAPSCEAFAEDVVTGRALASGCPDFVTPGEGGR
jgi:anti-sigma regulatory factor (Ser/Thr protein kinase)/Fe-S-cluster-containing hydrogenase component 2